MRETSTFQDSCIAKYGIIIIQNATTSYEMQYTFNLACYFRITVIHPV